LTGVVGHLGRGEAFLNLSTGLWSVNPHRYSVPVVSDPYEYIRYGIPCYSIAFLHTSFPTYGYIPTDCSMAARDYCFGKYGGYRVMITRRTLSAYCQDAGEYFRIKSLPAGTRVLIEDGTWYNDGTHNKMCIYGYKTPGSSYWVYQYVANGGVGWIDTGIASGSGEGSWGFRLNHAP
jgi:hypothetical protein